MYSYRKQKSVEKFICIGEKKSVEKWGEKIS